MTALHQAIEYSALGWVKPELDETLRLAQVEIEGFANDPADTSRMRVCGEFLHQVQGTLRMVELYAPAMVAEEMERLAQALEQDRVGDRDSACSALMRGVVLLPDYLERLQSGHREISIVLLPVLNELRAARGESGLSESVLFVPDLDRALPASLPRAPAQSSALRIGEVTPFLVRLRDALQSWPEQGKPADAEGLHFSIESLLARTSDDAQRRMLWVASMTASALHDGALFSSPGLRQAFGSVEREARRPYEQDGFGTQRADGTLEPTRQLLYHVAHSDSVHPALSKLREVFDLDALKPTESELDHARGSIAGRNRALLDTVSAAIKEDLLRVKDALDLYLRTGQRDTASLQPQVEALTRVSDTLGMLGLGLARTMVQQQRDDMQQIARGERAANETALMEIAGALLYVDATLDDQVERVASGDSADIEDHAASEARKVLDVLLREAITNFAAARQAFVAFVETAWNHGELAPVPKLLRDVTGALQILELPQPAEYLDGVRLYTEVELIGRRRIPNSRQLDTFADALSSIEYFLEALREHRANRDDILDITRNSLESLGYWPIPVAAIQTAPEIELPSTKPSIETLAAEFTPPVLQVAEQSTVAEESVAEESNVAHISEHSPEPASAATITLVEHEEAHLRDDDVKIDHVSLDHVSLEHAEEDIAVAALPGVSFDTHEAHAHELHAHQVDAHEVEAHEVVAHEVDSHVAVESALLQPVQIEAPQIETPKIPGVIAAAVSTPIETPIAAGFDVANDDIDDEIREIFLEEFEEEIENLRHLLPAWRAAPDNIEALYPIRRVFHTLKGSGRLVGAKTLGEFSWKIENLLNKVRDGLRPASPAVIAMTEQAAATLPQLHAALRGEGRITANLSAMEALADRIAGGEEIMPGAVLLVPSVTNVEPAIADIVAVPVAEIEVAAASAPTPSTAESLAKDMAALGEEGVVFSVDPVLFEILQAEVGGHLATINGWLLRARDGASHVDEPLVRAIHTMNGAFAMTEVPEITDALIPAEGYVRRLMSSSTAADAEGVDAIAELAERVRATISALSVQGARVPGCASLAARLSALRSTLPESKPLNVVEDAFADDGADIDIGGLEKATADDLQAIELTGVDLSAYRGFTEPAHEIPVASVDTADGVDETRRLLAFMESLEAERLATEHAEAQRLAAEHAAAEDAEAARIAAEHIESERLAAEHAETQRLAAEHAEVERLAAEHAEAERLAAEHAEVERLAAEHAEAERLAAEHAEVERLAAEHAEAERLAAEHAEAERLAAEHAAAERLAAEHAAAERVAAEHAGAERLAAEHAEAERLAAEHAAAERLAAEHAAAEHAEAQRREAEFLEAEHLDAQRREAELLEAERLLAEGHEEDQPAAGDYDEGMLFIDMPAEFSTHRVESHAVEPAAFDDSFAEQSLAAQSHAEESHLEQQLLEQPAAEESTSIEAPMVAESELEQPASESVLSLEAELPAFFDMSEIPSRVEVAAEAPAPLPAAAEDPDMPLDMAELDSELVDIFVEEAQDLLDHSDQLLVRLRDAPEERELITGLQRDLHTLKGGARMAGVMPIGELGHTMESMLEAVAEQRTQIGGKDIPLLERGFDRLHAMVTRVSARRAIGMPDKLIGEFEVRVFGERTTPDQDSAVGIETSLEEAFTVEHVGQAATQAADHTEEQSAARSAEASADQAALKSLSAPIEFGVVGDDDNSLRGTQEQVRVRAELLDRLVNYAGEVAIYRSRLEQQLGAFRAATTEMAQTNTRLRDQLRRLEIETEAQIIARYQREGETRDSAFDPLELDRFSNLQQLSRALAETATDLSSLQSTLDDLTQQYETLLLQQSRVSSELQEGLMRTRMVPFDTIVPRLRRVLRQAATDTGKSVQLKLDGAQGELDRNVLERMTAPLEHMLRNAVAHGLEMPKQRNKAGKPEEGTVRITVRKEGSEVVLQITDDGRGLDRKAIRERAEARGLIRKDAVLANIQLDAMILEPGFSTANEVSRLAGRGVGMDVVASEVRQLGGTLDIQSEKSQGSTFTLRLPQTLAVTQAAFVRIGEAMFAVPIASVRGVGRIPRKAIENGDTSYRYGAEEYVLHDLGKLIGHAPAKAEGQLQMPLLLTRSGDLHVAVSVDQIVGNREIVVKPIGPQVASIPGIFGATIMGDGSVVVILDVAPLVRRLVAQPEVMVEDTPLVVSAEHQVPLVMVVDDSITMRKVTGRVLERNNFEVVTAKDGLDALERMADRVPDLMLLDIEMPRMDGYELATIMKGDPRLKGVPIIMITSRTGEKHRQRAMEIGVNGYLGKPYQENELMRNVFSLLESVRSDG